MKDRDTFSSSMRLAVGRAVGAGDGPTRAIAGPAQRPDIVTVVRSHDDPSPAKPGYERVIVRLVERAVPAYLNDRAEQVLGKATDYSPISYAGLPARKHVRWDPAQGKFVVDVIVDAQALAERTMRSMHNPN